MLESRWGYVGEYIWGLSEWVVDEAVTVLGSKWACVGESVG